MKQRIEERRRRSSISRRRRKALTLVVIVAVFAMLATMCGKDIVSALKKQQIALEQQRDELKEELKVTNSQEYIREQAKKQLNLLNPGEILFTFDEEEPEENADKAEKTEKSDRSDKSDKDKDKDGGSDG